MRAQFFTRAIIADTRRAARVGLTAGVEMLKAEAIRLMKESPATGRLYKRGEVQHRASAPGEPPAPDLGNLLRNINSHVDGAALTGRVEFNTAYARRLEFGFMGTDAQGRRYEQQPRPFARPALANTREPIQDRLASEILKAITKPRGKGQGA